MAKKEVNLDEDGAESSGKGGRRWIVLALVAVLVAGAGAAAWFFLMGDQEAADSARAAPPERTYIELEPMTVNIEAPGRIRYLRTQITLVTHADGAADTVERHLPALRNDILGILTEQKYEDLNTRAGKEALAGTLEEAVVEVLASRGAPVELEGVLFNELVMQ
ncbi:MAG: flagellar basal body-associated FliL family protein [Thioalkalivibrio sp.]|nr:flagellar basal body-associated FliL family protein [Thioalkalivibrio sp.]